MGLKFTIEGDVKAIQKALSGLPKQISFATMNALNATAEQVKELEQKRIRQTFDRPTKWIPNGLRVKYAKRNKLTAEVGFKDALGLKNVTATAEEILSVHIHGGARRMKRGERALAARGRMGGKQFYAPGSGVRLNQYGNITRGMMTKILSDVRGHRDVAQDTNIVKQKRFFILKRGGNPVGIFERTGRGKNSIKPVIVFISKPTYRARFPFYRIADLATAKWFPRFARKAIDHELRTLKW